MNSNERRISSAIKKRKIIPNSKWDNINKYENFLINQINSKKEYLKEGKVNRKK